MKIRSKVLISFLSLVILITLAIQVLMYNFFQPQFTKLEEAQFRRDILSIQNLIAQEVHRIEAFSRDWAVWDQTYQFLENRNQEYLDSNLYPELNDDLELDLTFLVHNSGRIIWQLERYQSTPSELLPNPIWPTSHPFFNQDKPIQAGIALTPDGPLLFASSKVTNGEEDQSSNGILVFGRYLNEDLIQVFRERSLLPLAVDVVESSEVSLNIEFINNQEAISQAFLPLFNSSTQQLEIKLTTPRELHQQANETILMVTLLTFGSGLLLTLMVYLFLSRHILIPIGKLNQQAEEFGKDSHTIDFTDSQRSDEIGTLFRTFRLMAQKILSYQHKLVQEKQSFQQASLTDQLTGLNNRRYLSTVLHERINDQSNVIWQFIMLDMDHFKQVNDHYGHDVGDKVLQQLADVLRDCARHDDHIIRYGGEEFLIAIRDQSYEAAETLAERLLQQVARTPFGEAGQHFSKTCSVGFFSFRAPTLNSLDDIERYISFADSALYAAKNNGRNRWVGIKAKSDTIPADHNNLIQLIEDQNLEIISPKPLSLDSFI